MNTNERYVESPITTFLMNKASQARIPLSGAFELSPVCNFACRMCYVRKTPAEVRAHSRPMMTLAQWLAIAEEAREQGMLYLLLTGGEPFLWPEFWELYDRLIDMGFLISINSNGSLIDEAAIARLRAKPPVRVNITLYGAGDETYETLCGAKHVFSRVDRAISGLQAAGVQVKLNCSLTPYNAPDLEAMTAYAQARGLILECTTYMFPPLRRDPASVGVNDRFTPEQSAFYHMRRYRLQSDGERYRKFLENIAAGIVPPPGLDESCIDPLDGRIRCRAGKAAFWITWDGYLTPCGMLPEPKIDLYAGTFTEAWHALTEESGALTLSGVCQNCQNREMCHACAAMAKAETGIFSGIPTYLCQTVAEMKRLALAVLAGETENMP